MAQFYSSIQGNRGQATWMGTAVLEHMADTLADLYAAADPTFDRAGFLRRCGL